MRRMDMKENIKRQVFYHIEHLMMMVMIYFEMMLIHKYLSQASMNDLFWLYAYMVVTPIIVLGVIIKEARWHKQDIFKHIYAIGVNLSIQYSLMIICYILCNHCCSFGHFFYQFLILSLMSSFMSWRIWLYMIHEEINRCVSLIMFVFIQVLIMIGIIFLRSSWTIWMYVFSLFIQLSWLYD